MDRTKTGRRPLKRNKSPSPWKRGEYVIVCLCLCSMYMMHLMHSVNLAIQINYGGMAGRGPRRMKSKSVWLAAGKPTCRQPVTGKMDSFSHSLKMSSQSSHWEMDHENPLHSRTFTRGARDFDSLTHSRHSPMLKMRKGKHRSC